MHLFSAMWNLTASRIVRVLQPKVRPDDDVAVLVRAKLPLLVAQPGAIEVEVEHGCVLLRGPVSGRERAHLVRAIAIVRGVDSVIDLLHERESGAPAGAELPARRAKLALVRAPWPLGPRLAAAGAGAGLAIAGARVGGLLGVPLALAGTLLFVRAATGTTLRPAAG